MSMKKGKTLTEESWKTALENIKAAIPFLAEIIERANFEGKGKEDSEEFAYDMALACMAMLYVAMTPEARAKCIIMPMEEENLN